MCNSNAKLMVYKQMWKHYMRTNKCKNFLVKEKETYANKHTNERIYINCVKTYVSMYY